MPRRSPDRGRRRTRRLLLLAATALVALLLLEGSSRVLERLLPPAPGLPGQFATAAEVVPVFRRDDSGPRPRYVRTQDHWIPTGERFEAVKGPSTFRVFSLGGSAAMGWPHHPDASYAKLLQVKLRRLLPGWTVEVLNVAGNTYGSHRVRVVAEEVVAYQPDLVLFYDGNNEFVERVVFPVGSRCRWERVLDRLAFRRLIRRALPATDRARHVFSVRSYGPDALVDNRISAAFGRPVEQRRDPEEFRLVGESFRTNLEAIATSCHKRGIPLVLLTTPLNLKDWRPCTSFHRSGLSGDELERWREAYRSGILAREGGRWAEAQAALERAVAIDPEHAEAYFELGTALHSQGRWSEAKSAFTRALEQDGFPVRSLFNPTVREVASRRGLPLVDLVPVLEADTADATLGFSHLVDYVHPTVATNERIASEAARVLIENGLLPAPPAVPLAAAHIPVPAGIEEELWTLRGLFGQYLSLRQFDGLEALAARIHREAEAIMAVSPARRPELGRLLARVDRTVEVAVQYRRLLRAEKLGLVEQEFTPERAAAVFAAYVELIRASEEHALSAAEFDRYLPRSGFSLDAE
jgi:hypothetical protein